MMRYFTVAAFLVLVFGGCAKVVPAVSEYRINQNTYNIQSTSHGCKEKSLKVGQAFSETSLMNLDIMYGIGEQTQYRYTQSKWAQTPNAAITSEIVRFLQKADIFASVSVPKSRVKSDYILETNIEDFMQYFSADEKSSVVKASLTFSLLDTKDNSVVATKSLAIELPSKTLDAEGGAIALNEALKTLLEQSGVWLDESCR